MSLDSTIAYPTRFDDAKFVIKLPTDDGGEFAWELVDPNPMFASVAAVNERWASLIKAAVAERPPTIDNKWSLILGYDEFSPGNTLKVDNRRKTMVLSFTFLELGQSAISSGEGWVTPVCVRPSNINKVTGGWPCMLKHYLHRQLFGPVGLLTSGLVMDLGGAPIVIFAKLANLLTDGDGFRGTFDWRGHASLRPCFKHWNVFKKVHDDTHTHTPPSVARVTGACRLTIVGWVRCETM